MAYKITIDESGFCDFISITEEEFQRIREAKKIILHGITLEAKLDHVLENYAELESELLNMALEHSIFPGKINDLLDGGAHLLNRRIVNLLTTTRLFLADDLDEADDLLPRRGSQAGLPFAQP